MEPRFTMLIDGDCPLCRREAALLRRLDRGRGRLVLVDITGPAFQPAVYGRTMAELMGEIHGVRADGTLATGMEVFRRAYSGVGYGWLLAPTGWPGFRRLFDACYHWFARNRLRLTGRSCGTARCGSR